jgi:UMF1 family MFS transporter
LKITIVIWGFICVAAYLLDAKSKSIDIQFYALGTTIGMVLGAIQSLSRPLTQNYYQKQRIMLRISAFDVTEKSHCGRDICF